MLGNISPRRSKLNKTTVFAGQKKNLHGETDGLLGFVGNQFRQLVKKNLQIPIKLYQL